MKDSERIKNEIITLLLLILTIAFTSSNLTSETFEDRSLAEISPSSQTIY